MKLYLVQHGEAKSKEDDQNRHLTDKGISDVKAVTKIAAQYIKGEVSRIVHSGKTRAQQTAEIIAEILNPKGGVHQEASLEPLADPLIWVEKLNKINEDTVLVGHLPYLSKLAAYLLLGDTENEIIQFKMGGMVCLERREGRDWSLVWMLIPEVVCEGEFDY